MIVLPGDGDAPLSPTLVMRAFAFAQDTVGSADRVRVYRRALGIVDLFPMVLDAGSIRTVYRRPDGQLRLLARRAAETIELPEGPRALDAVCRTVGGYMSENDFPLSDGFASAPRWIGEHYYTYELPEATYLVYAVLARDEVELSTLGIGSGFGEAERAVAVRRRCVWTSAPLSEPALVIAGGDDERENRHYISKPERFAVDLVPTRRGPARVTAVCAGTVANTEDGCDDDLHHDDGSRIRRPFGNCVTVDTGEALVFYAHLKLGSLRVRAGDVVRSGTLLGIVGNSGYSSSAHLHVHAQTKDAIALGVPVRLRLEDGSEVDVVRGSVIAPAARAVTSSPEP